MAAVRKNADPFDRADVYQKQIAGLKNLEAINRLNAAASGDWHVQTVKNISASERLTQQIQQQKLGLKGLVQEFKNYRNSAGGGNSPLREAIKEQQALRGAMASQMTGNTFGKNNTDLYVPRNLTPELESARVKYGMINQAIASAAHQTVNWGKNMQWAGRQITVGLTMPLGMAAVGAAALAMKVDEELTRVVKVYDTTAKTQKGKEEELAALRQQSFEGATRMAKTYGAKLADILDVEAQLAATGLTGGNLHQSTEQAVRIATLGEMDYQKAVDMTISLQTAFKLSNEELTKSFDMMNAVDNATSLSIQDIADAVPRAASALSQLGGTVSDLTVMMTAMKESGVNPEQGANALKSAASKLLAPSANAIALFRKNFNIDLKGVVADAKGNVYEILKTLSGMTKGFDSMKIQQGINALFGTYQFNRIAALWTNLGDAVDGVANQTRAAMDTVAKDSITLADIADQELKRRQESIQGKFKSAVASIQASLVPVGMTVLKFITPIINGIASLLTGFNNLSGFSKTLILSILGFGAVVGPVLMLVGIFANLFGNVVKLGSSLANLRYKFSALTPEEAAAKIMANNASSAFNAEAQSVGFLAQTIRDLTIAMEENAVASGMMMSKNGKMVARAADGMVHTRQVHQDDKGVYRYTAGSKNASGNTVAGGYASKEDREAFKEIQARSAATAESSAKTATNWKGIGKVLATVAGAGLVFGAMNKDAGGMSDSFMNIAMAAMTVSMIFPGIFKGAYGMAVKITKQIGLWAVAAKAAMSFSSLKLGASMVAGGFAEQAGAGALARVRGIGTGIAAWMPRLTSVAAIAGRIFLPLGILAGGALIIKAIITDMNKMDTQQRALATSGKAWADTLGYTYAPRTLPGLPEGDTTSIAEMKERSGIIKTMTKDNDDLSKAMRQAGKEGRGYEAAMQQALRALSDGASTAQARKVMEASLDMAGKDPFEIQDAMVKFDKIDLADPKAVHSTMERLLQDASNSVTVSAIHPSQNNKDGMWGSFTSALREAFGGDLTDEMRTYGERMGNALADGLNSAGNDMKGKVKLFDTFQTDINNKLGGEFNKVKKQYKKEFSDLGIDTMDELMSKLAGLQKKYDKGGWSDMSKSEKKLFRELQDGTSTLSTFQGEYQELLETIIQGIGDVLGWDQSKIDDTIDKVITLGKLKPTLGVQDSIMSVTDATVGWNMAMQDATSKGQVLTEKQKLAILNTWRQKAGMDAAKTSTQGFGDAAADAAKNTADMADVIRDATNAANDLYRVTADDAANSQKSAMQGAWSDIMAEADRQYNEMRDNAVEAIRQQADATQAGFDAEEKSTAAHYDALEAAQQKSFDIRTKQVQAAIDAEKKADDERKRIFEDEQRRIERAAARANGSIDMNVAINSGHFDEAAKMANDASAREQGYAIDDANRGADEASAARTTALQQKLDSLKAEQDAQKAALDASRKMAEDDLKNRRDADKKATDSHIKAVQDQTEADKREMAKRLRVLQEFVPENEAELRKHVGDVEAVYRDYGLNLTAQGKGWSNVVGDALKTNIGIAAAALQTSINWRGIAKNIASQIGDGMGMTMAQVTEFLRTGKWPGGTPAAAPAVKAPTQPITSFTTASTATTPGRPIYYNPNTGAHNVTGPQAFHAGGQIPFTGGRSNSSRVGVPKGASPYHSEVPILAKAGEFVVNDKAAQNNLELLHAINSGNKDIGGVPIAGPLVELAMGNAALTAMTMAETAGIALRLKLQQGKANYIAAQAAATAASGGATIDGGGGMVYQRLFSTIRRFFPRAKLNSGYRPGANDYHGMGDAVDLGEEGFAGGTGRPYLANMNRWIYDNYRGIATELIYNGAGDDRPNLKNGRDYAYSAGLQAQHRNHVHWAMTPAAIALANSRGLTGPAAIAAGPQAVSGNQAIVKNLAASMYGWTGAQWNALYQLVMGESGFRNTAQNPSSTAYGMFQFLNSTWAGTGYSKTSDPTIQTKAGLAYIHNAYGTPGNAYAKWSARSPHWYDNGGYLQPGMTTVMNGTGKPEPVFTAEQWATLKANIGSNTYNMGRDSAPMPVRLVEDVANGGDSGYTVTIDLRGAYIKEELDIEAAVQRAIDKKESKNGRRRVI